VQPLSQAGSSVARSPETPTVAPATLHALRAASAARDLHADVRVADSPAPHWQEVEHGAVRTTPATPSSGHDVANAAKYVKGLEYKVRRVLRRIKAEKAATEELEAKRTHLVQQMDEALSITVATTDDDASGTNPVMMKFFRLHEALAAAHTYLQEQTAALDEQEGALKEEISNEEVSLLYRMLKQRRTLPLQSQLAVLRRDQFSRNTFAAALLKKHDEKKPLYEQLEAELPKATATHLLSGLETPKQRGHLEAAGSEGRVHIVSSRVKHSVDGMVKELEQARLRLVSLANGAIPNATAFDKEQASHVLAELDPLLSKAQQSHDLRFQLEAMDEVQRRMQQWMHNATAARA